MGGDGGGRRSMVKHKCRAHLFFAPQAPWLIEEVSSGESGQQLAARRLDLFAS